LASTTAGGKSPGRTTAPRGTSGTLRQRKTGGTSSGGTRTRAAASSGGGGMWRFYTDDSPGIKIGPVPVLIMSLVFIASVFMLHIWGKYTRHR
uniref:Protein transport protein Sec61 subunit beta n=1 Tax=Romanomermis culicivorax TaxID=13658 RepID=A0A915JPB2_ROMCU